MAALEYASRILSETQVTSGVNGAELHVRARLERRLPCDSR